MSYEADIKHLRLIHYIACALALLPPYTAATHSRLFRLYKLYALVAIIFYSCLVPYFIYAKYIKRTVCMDCNYVRNTIEAIYQTIQVLSAIVTATDSTFRHGNKFHRFVKLLLAIKVKGREQRQGSCSWSHVQLPTVLLHSCIAVIIALQVYIVIKRLDTGIIDGKYVYVYGVGLSTLMVYKYLSVIKRQLVFLNRQLIRGAPDFESIANAREVYYEISRVVLAFNDAFGLRIFIIYAYCFIGSLHVASLAINYIIDEGDVKMVYMMCVWSSAIIVSILKKNIEHVTLLPISWARKDVLFANLPVTTERIYLMEMPQL